MMIRFIKFICIVVSIFMLTACVLFPSPSKDVEPLTTESHAKIVFVRDSDEIFSEPRFYLKNLISGRSIPVDYETKNRDFGVILNDRSSIVAQIYLETDEKINVNGIFYKGMLNKYKCEDIKIFTPKSNTTYIVSFGKHDSSCLLKIYEYNNQNKVLISE